MEVCESGAERVESVQVWGLEDRIAQAAQVALALIIRHDEDDIGAAILQGGGDRV